MTDEELDSPEPNEPDGFETNLRAYLGTLGQTRRRKAHRLLRLLNAPRTRRRARKLAQLQTHLAVHLHEVGVTGTANPRAIDWSSIDWSAIFDVLMRVFEFIMAILPLFISVALTVLLTLVASTPFA